MPRPHLTVLSPPGRSPGRRRAFAVGAAVLALTASSLAVSSPARADVDPLSYVDPFLGTGYVDGSISTPGGGGGGGTYPGASVPFGMLQFSPDTPGADPAGYNYTKSTISGFSLTHFNGAGCPNNEDLPILPTLSPGDSSPVGFSHTGEQASPGYYRVGLANGVTTELTTTTRTAMARFTYPSTSTATVLLDLGHKRLDPASTYTVVDGQHIRGTVTVGAFCGFGGNRTPLHFYAEFSRPVTTTYDSTGQKLYASFDATSDQALTLKVGVSYVSEAGAQANLAAENASSSFDDVRGAARSSWGSILGRVQVGGGSDTELTKFYTALYHVFLAPNVYSDTDRSYLGFDQQVHTAASTFYTTFSGWDVYRTQMPLLAALAPDVARDFARSLVAGGQECGVIGRWLELNGETSIMVGDPAAPTLSSIDAFGVTDFDRQGAYALLKKAATEQYASCQGLQIRPALGDWISKNYLATTSDAGWNRDNGTGSAAVSLEYATDDYALSQFASRLGQSADASTFATRSHNWTNLFDGSYIHGRNADGTFRTPFSVTSQQDFVEGNAAQYTFMVPHDLRGLGDALGGNSVAVSRLDDLFSNLLGGVDQPYFYIGNEPQMAQPWAYDWYGRPDRTQDVVRRIRRDTFTTGPGGLPGNDDLGTTSAWYVWASLGLFPETPGTDVLAVNSPVFPQISIAVPGGWNATISAPGASNASPYVSALSVNGSGSNRPWVRYADIKNGSLAFTMSSSATSWGSDPADAPPSYAQTTATVQPAPSTTAATTTTAPPAETTTTPPAETTTTPPAETTTNDEGGDPTTTDDDSGQ